MTRTNQSISPRLPSTLPTLPPRRNHHLRRLLSSVSSSHFFGRRFRFRLPWSVTLGQSAPLPLTTFISTQNDAVFHPVSTLYIILGKYSLNPFAVLFFIIKSIPSSSSTPLAAVSSPKSTLYSILFLVAYTRLYKSVCQLVGWSVGRSVGPSVIRSVRPSRFTFFH